MVKVTERQGIAVSLFFVCTKLTGVIDISANHLLGQKREKLKMILQGI